MLSFSSTIGEIWTNTQRGEWDPTHGVIAPARFHDFRFFWRSWIQQFLRGYSLVLSLRYKNRVRSDFWSTIPVLFLYYFWSQLLKQNSYTVSEDTPPLLFSCSGPTLFFWGERRLFPTLMSQALAPQPEISTVLLVFCSPHRRLSGAVEIPKAPPLWQIAQRSFIFPNCARLSIGTRQGTYSPVHCRSFVVLRFFLSQFFYSPASGQ